MSTNSMLIESCQNKAAEAAESLRIQANVLVDAVLSKRDSESLLNLLAIRILIGIGVFAILNVIVVAAHHVAFRVSRSKHQYREMEHTYSPF